MRSFPIRVTVTTMGYRSYKNPLNKAPLRTVTGRGNDPINADIKQHVAWKVGFWECGLLRLRVWGCFGSGSLKAYRMVSGKAAM